MAGRAALVRDVMSEDVITVSSETTVAVFLELAEEHEISGAPVVDDGGGVLGVVSLTDVLRLLEGDVFSALDGPGGGAASTDVTVGEIMTPATISIAAGTGISEAATFLQKADVHRALVFEGDRLVGVVTTHDLLAALLDEEG